MKLADNANTLKSSFKNSSDVVFGEFEVYPGIKALMAYIDGLVDTDVLNRDIVRSFLTKAGETEINAVFNSPGEIRSLISVPKASETKKFSDVIAQILNGNSALFIDGMDWALIINSKGWDKRAIEKSENESVIRGPKESFVENLRTNTSLLRRKIRNKNLVFENFLIGSQTRTQVAIAYIGGIAKQRIVDEVRRRLNNIDTDSILDTGYLEQFIEDHPSSLFPTIGNTEKPDVVAGKILKGRVGIFCDGSPNLPPRNDTHCTANKNGRCHEGNPISGSGENTFDDFPVRSAEGIRPKTSEGHRLRDKHRGCPGHRAGFFITA